MSGNDFEDSDSLITRAELEEIHKHQLELKALFNISPDDAKYRKSSDSLREYLSAGAEWFACADVEKALMETLVEYGKAKQKNLDEVDNALRKISPLEMERLEAEVTKHDQLAVIEELGKYVSQETKALFHPGTTSFDKLDTARAYLFKGAWKKVIRPKIREGIEKLCVLSEKSMDIIRAGRTHLQQTSPVSYGMMFASYAARLADRVEMCDTYFDKLKGKISGIVGTGAGIEMVVGEGKSVFFEIDVLKKLDLEPDYTATQVTQKERLADVGNGLTTLLHVLEDFANDIRLLYSSEISEVTSRDNAERLGGSSADATKNNPIQYENMCGKASVVESGMRVLYEMIATDIDRDLKSSVMARYQPQQMMAQTYESFSRLSKALDQLSINEDKVAEHLQKVRDNPSEAMVQILKGERFIHSQYGLSHDFVKETGKKAKKSGQKLLDVAMQDEEFKKVYSYLDNGKKSILSGRIDEYIGSAKIRADHNIKYARKIILGG